AEQTFWVRRMAAGAYVYLPARPAVARDAAGRPRFALTLVLARMPAITDESIAPLVTGGSLALMCNLAVDHAGARAVEGRLGAVRQPLFGRGGSGLLRDAATVFAQADLLGAGVCFSLGTWLPAQQALDVLQAIDGVASRLRVEVRNADGAPPVLAPL